MLTTIVPKHFDKKRLDIFLTQFLNEKGFELTRSGCAKFIPVGVYKSLQEGVVFTNKHLEDKVASVSVNNKEVIDYSKSLKPSYNLSFNETIFIDDERLKKYIADIEKTRANLEEPAVLTMSLEEVKKELEIIFENESFLVINKKCGIPVQSANFHEKSLASLIRTYLERSGQYNEKLRRAGLVHRLDRSVGGLILFAKEYVIQQNLMKKFEHREIEKYYLARIDEKYLSVAEKGFSVGSIFRLEGWIFRDKRRIRKSFKILRNSRVGELNDFLSSKTLSDSKGPFNFGNFNGWDSEKILEINMNESAKKLPVEQAEFNSLHDKKAKYSVLELAYIGSGFFLIKLLTGRNHQIRASFKALGMIINKDSLYSSKCVIPNSIDLFSILMKFCIEKKQYTFKLNDTIGDLFPG